VRWLLQTFDNEGKYFLDFSVGFPIKKVTDLQYINTSNALVPASVQRQSLFGFVNAYFKPVDIKNTSFSPWPHFVGGVSLASQPLYNIIVGGAYGPYIANFYFGLLIQQKSLPQNGSCGSTPSSPVQGKLSIHTCLGFSFGLNVGSEQ